MVYRNSPLCFRKLYMMSAQDSEERMVLMWKAFPLLWHWDLKLSCSSRCISAIPVSLNSVEFQSPRLQSKSEISKSFKIVNKKKKEDQYYATVQHSVRLATNETNIVLYITLTNQTRLCNFWQVTLRRVTMLHGRATCCPATCCLLPATCCRQHVACISATCIPFCIQQQTGNKLATILLTATSNMLPWCKRGFINVMQNC